MQGPKDLFAAVRSLPLRDSGVSQPKTTFLAGDPALGNLLPNALLNKEALLPSHGINPKIDLYAIEKFTSQCNLQPDCISQQVGRRKMAAYKAAADGSLMALADCDSFYASCERVCRPDLAGRAIVVLSNNDGCIVARSKEAKKLGIPMGEPEFKLRSLLKKHNVAVFSSNYTLYGDLSHRVMLTLQSVSPCVEVYSIDEAFLPLSGALAANADELARIARNRVGRWLGLPLSIGIAPTRVLAKIATRVAKKNPEYKGVFNLLHANKPEEILAKVDVGDIWGIGRRGAWKLKNAGIHNALQLREADPGFIRKLLTICGLNILMELKGIPSIGEDIPATHSAVISSRSLGYKVRDFAPLAEATAFHAARAGEKLRAKKLYAQMVSARVQTSWARKDEPQYDEMAMVRLERPSLDSAVFISAALRGLERIFKPGYAYAKVMVMLTDLSDPTQGQHDLSNLLKDMRQVDQKRKDLLELMDRINRVEGRGTLHFASQGPKNAKWHMKRDRLSPAWTTDSQELLKIGGNYKEQFAGCL